MLHAEIIQLTQQALWFVLSRLDSAWLGSEVRISIAPGSPLGGRRIGFSICARGYSRRVN